MTIHHPTPGIVGSGVTVSGMLTPLVAHTPEMQALGALVGLIAGVLTVAWYVRQFFKK